MNSLTRTMGATSRQPSVLRVMTGGLIAGVLLLSGCRSGMDRRPSEPTVAIRESAPSAGQAAAVRVISDGSRSAAYYYYAAAQRVLKTGQVDEAVWLLEKAVASDPGSPYLMLELAELLDAQEQWQRAAELIEQVLAHWPDYLPALTLAGKIYQQRQEPEKAKAVFERAITADPQDPRIYIFLGQLYWNEDDLSNARRVFEQMVDHIPDAYAGHFFLGKLLVNQGNLEPAIEAFNRSLSIDPSLEEPRLELIEVYKELQRKDQVVGLYQDILAFDPGNFKAAFDLALYNEQIGRSKDAASLLVQLGRQSRVDDRVLAPVFELLEAKQYQTAEWVLESMLEGAPSSSELHYLAGAACDGLDQPRATLDHLQQVHADSRFYPNAVVHSAMLHYNAGRMEAAIRVIEQAIAQVPEHADFYYYLAGFYEEQERLGEAVEVLEKGLTANAENVRLFFRLGVMQDKMGRREQAIETMKELVSIAPDHADALNYLGYTYAEMGIHLDEAERLIRSALKNKPENGYITDSLGWVYYKKGEYQKALEWLHRALRLVPDDPTILEHVGDVYLKLNQVDQALDYFHQSLEVNPVNRDALKEKIHSLRQLSDAPNHP